jgi:hypothetical protein
MHLEGEFRGEIAWVAQVCVAVSTRQKIEAGQNWAAPHANVWGLEAGTIAPQGGTDVPRELMSPRTLVVLRRQIILRESQCHAFRSSSFWWLGGEGVVPEVLWEEREWVPFSFHTNSSSSASKAGGPINFPRGLHLFFGAMQRRMQRRAEALSYKNKSIIIFYPLKRQSPSTFTV